MRVEQLFLIWVYLEEWKKGKIGGNILNMLKGYQMLSKYNEDFWRIAAVILTGGVEDLNSKKKIKKYNFDNPDAVVRIFKKIIKE